MLRQKTKKSPMAFKKSLNRRFDPACQVKFMGIIRRRLKKSTLFSGPDFTCKDGAAPLSPSGAADRSLTNAPVSVLWTWRSGAAPTQSPFEVVSDFVLRISNLAPACPGWDMHA